MYGFIKNINRKYWKETGYKAAIFRTSSYNEWQDVLYYASRDRRVESIVPEVNDSEPGSFTPGWEYFRDYLA